MWKKTMLIYRISSLLHVVAYGLMVYFVVYRLIAREDVLVTYLLNIVMIISGLYADKVARRFAKKSEVTIREMIFSGEATFIVKFSRLLYIFSQVFFRTTMYQFYMVTLILSVVATQRPDFLPFELGNFFSSIEYGILLLLVFDNIKQLTAKDGAWLRQHIGLEQRDDSDESEI